MICNYGSSNLKDLWYNNLRIGTKITATNNQFKGHLTSRYSIFIAFSAWHLKASFFTHKNNIIIDN